MCPFFLSGKRRSRMSGLDWSLELGAWSLCVLCVSVFVFVCVCVFVWLFLCLFSEGSSACV